MVLLHHPLNRLRRQLFLDGECAEDFLADHPHDEFEQALREFDNHVADEAIGDDDIGFASVNIAAFDVPHKAIRERTIAEQRVGFLHEIVPFAFFFADVHEADRRPVDAEHVLGECRPHRTVFEQVAWLREHVRADIHNHATAFRRRHDRGDTGAMDAFEELPREQPTRHDGTRVARADEAIDRFRRQKLPAFADRAIGLRAKCLGWLFVHANALRGVNDLDAVGRIIGGRCEKGFDLRAITDEDHG